MPRRLFFRLLTAATPAGDHVADTELLRRFARGRDPAAFELLARRHAEAVWTACRRVLRSEADAEDAFQATFLVLARKAGTVRGDCVGGWLYRVAVNAALKMKADRDRRGAGDLEAHPVPDGGSPAPAAERDELAAVVQEEIARLPERYRLPVVLCDLEGHTHAEAAVVLRWPVGSVSGRLSRARGILRDRLTRRGFAPASLAVLPAGGLPAGAVRAATAAACGTGPVSLPVATLTQGVISAMHTAKLKLVAAVVASVGLLGLAGVGTVAAWPRTDLPVTAAAPAPPERPVEGDWIPAKPGDPVPTAFPGLKAPAPGDPNAFARACPRLSGKQPVTIEPTDDTYRRLLKAQLHQGQMEVDQRRTRIVAGHYTFADYTDWLRACTALGDLATELWANDPANAIPWLEELVVLAKENERISLARVQTGADPPHVLHAAVRHRLKTEAALWKARHPGGRAK